MLKRENIQKYSAILNPNVTHKATVEFTVKNGVPNGDPNTGGARLDSDNHALVTGVATKRKVRDYAEGQLKRTLYVSRFLQEQKNDPGMEASGKCVLLKDWARFKGVNSAESAVQTFWDVRLFGAVIGEADAKEQILGPVQVGICRSEAPVADQVITITRMASETKDQARTMGTFAFVPEATFKQKVIYTGHLGINHKVSSEDLLDLWESLINGFDYRPSTMRGEQVCVKLTINTYPNALGALDEGEKPLTTVISNVLDIEG